MSEGKALDKMISDGSVTLPKKTTFFYLFIYLFFINCGLT